MKDPKEVFMNIRRSGEIRLHSCHLHGDLKETPKSIWLAVKVLYFNIYKYTR